MEGNHESAPRTDTIWELMVEAVRAMYRDPRAILRMMLIGAISFAFFFDCVGFVAEFGPKDWLTVALTIPLLLVVIVGRISTYFPLLRVPFPMAVEGPQTEYPPLWKPKSAWTFAGALEGLTIIGALSFATWYFLARWRFGLISNLGGPWWVFAIWAVVGLVLAALATVIGSVVLIALGSALGPLFREMALFRVALRRIAAFSVLFGIFVTAFSVAYRVVSLDDPTAFIPKVKNLADAFYLSATSATVFGAVNVYPNSSASRFLVGLETLLGALLIFALLVFILGLPIPRPGRKGRPHLRRDRIGGARANSLRVTRRTVRKRRVP